MMAYVIPLSNRNPRESQRRLKDMLAERAITFQNPLSSHAMTANNMHNGSRSTTSETRASAIIISINGRTTRAVIGLALAIMAEKAKKNVQRKTQNKKTK